MAEKHSTQARPSSRNRLNPPPEEHPSGAAEPMSVLITGASSGIGRATAELLASRGYRVFGTSRRPQSVTVDTFTLLPLDVRSPESIRTCVDAVIERAGRIDVLINNAGYIGPAAASEELSLEQMRAIFETNFFGAVAMVNAVLPWMRRQRQGWIVNVSSVGGRMGFPFFSAYVSSKHALEGYTECLRYEVSPFNIRVVLIEPGFIRSKIAESIEKPERALAAYAPYRTFMSKLDRYFLKHGRHSDLVACAIARALESDRPRLRYLVGNDALVIAGGKRWLPFSFYESITRWFTLQRKERLGIRKYFANSKFVDTRLLPALGSALLALGAWLLLHRKKCG